MKEWVYIIQKVEPISSGGYYSVSEVSKNEEKGHLIEWQYEVNIHSGHIKPQNPVTNNHCQTTNLNKCIKNYFNNRMKIGLMFNKTKDTEVRAIYHDIEENNIFRTS